MLSMSRLAAKQRTARGDALQPLLPGDASSSEKGCACSGHVRELMKDGSAWLLPHHQIDHPASEKNFGSIFMAAADLCEGSELKEGDRVVFNLVVDAKSQELRAENCRLKRNVVVRMRDAPLWLLDDSDDEDALVERNMGISSSSSSNGSTTIGDSTSEQESLSECDGEPEPDGEPDEEPVVMECLPCGLPSVGSALHEAGKCVPCGFFMWGLCSKGKDCGKCHCQHVSLFNCCDSDDE